MESRPRARGGIASIGEVLCTSPPVGRALTRSGLAVVNAPFRECVVLSLHAPVCGISLLGPPRGGRRGGEEDQAQDARLMAGMDHRTV